MYVDNDPIVLAHAHALLTGTPGTIDYLHADLRDVEGILSRASATLDFDRPVALMLLMSLQFVPDEEDAHGIVARLVDALAPGSVLVLSHPALITDPAGDQAVAEYNKRVAAPMTPRSEASIARFFDGLDLVEPGLVPLAVWNPDGDGPEPAGGEVSALCGMGRKP